MNLSPLALALQRALRDNAWWRGEYPSWLGIAMWAHGYTERKHTREEVAEALEELREEQRRRRARRAA
jgi:hypothetical protein